MRKARWMVLMLLATILLAPLSVRAEGWQWPNLNPFAKKEPKSTLPKWPPENKPMQIPKPAAPPTTMQKMSNGWHSLVNSINPWAEKPSASPTIGKPFVPGGVNPAGKGFSSSANDPSPRPQTVPSFLAQPRPVAN